MLLQFPQLIFPFVCYTSSSSSSYFQASIWLHFHFEGIRTHVFNYHILLCWILMTVISLFDVLVIVHSRRLSTSTPDSVPYELSARAKYMCRRFSHRPQGHGTLCVCACVPHACLKSCMYICCMYAEYKFNLKTVPYQQRCRYASPHRCLFCFTISYMINQ